MLMIGKASGVQLDTIELFDSFFPQRAYQYISYLERLLRNGHNEDVFENKEKKFRGHTIHLKMLGQNSRDADYVVNIWGVCLMISRTIPTLRRSFGTGSQLSVQTREVVARGQRPNSRCCRWPAQASTLL